MYLGISFPRTPAHDQLVSLLFLEHNVHILSTFLIQLKPFSKCLPTCLLPFWMIWFKCFLINRCAYIHTSVVHPLPCTPLASILWATIWLLLNASIHCSTAFIYSLPKGQASGLLSFYFQKLEIKSTQVQLLIIMLLWW